MAKAHIKSPDGTTITIEGEAAEVAAIVHRVRGTAAVPGPSANQTVHPVRKPTRKIRDSAFNRILNLKDEGFFDQPKTLAMISGELEKSGYLYPITSLSGVMLSVVQKRLLA